MKSVSPLLALLFTAASASAQPVPAPEGALQTLLSQRPFDRYDLPVGPATSDGPVLRRVEGAVVWRADRLDREGATVAAVADAYRAALTGDGFDLLLDCASDGCGGFDFRFGISILPPPDMLVDVGDFAQISASKTREDGVAEVLVSVLISRVLGSVYVQTVRVVPAANTQALEPPSERGAGDTPVTTAAEEQALLESLQRDGHVQIAGIDFATGGAGLAAGSGDALALVARLLRRRADLSVIVVGHSDNEGGLDPNIALSQRRAETVVQALIDRGVSRKQLSARGIGYLAPIASNTTAEGRARNRRVELVLQ